MMIRVCSLALLLVWSVACEDKKPDASSKPGTEESVKPPSEEPVVKEPAAPAPPYVGKLSHERVQGAKGLVQPFQPWSEAFNALQAQLGVPTQVDGADNLWVFADDAHCTLFSVEEMKHDEFGAVVGTVVHPMTITPEMAREWKRCLEITGKAPPEDPNVPGAPEDGTPTSPTALKTGVEKAPSRWVGKKVKLTGAYNSTSTAKSGDKTYVTLSIGASKEDLMTTVGCSLADPKAALPKLFQADIVTVEGIVTDSAGLDACVFLSAAPK